MLCEICKKNIAIVDTFLGGICFDCDKKTDALAEEKLKTWKLPKFDSLVYCPMCEANHSNNTWCQANFENRGDLTEG